VLGSDRRGRDVASRVIYGARMSLLVGFSSVALGCAAGFILAVTTGYIGKWPDMAAQFLVDVLLAFPFLILAIVIVAVLGASTLNIIMAISIGYVPWTARIVRSTVLTLKEREFVMAAVASGASQWRIMFRHIAPNCVAPFLVILTAGIGGAIIAEATLSFLGLGLPPPTASWGRDLQEGSSRLIESAPWLSIFPGIAISLTVYGFNLFGDALRDVFDPRMRTL
jgi:peptide/nickel transport system permease protein